MSANTAVILVAAGQGSRMGGGLAKQWRMLAGQPVLAHAAAAFRAAGLARIITAIRPEDAPRAEALGLPWVAGGATRAASVRAALEHLANDPPERVLIHDGARPLASPALIARVLAALDHHSGAAPALALSDALWRAGDGKVRVIQPREGLFRAQTPQGFAFPAILAAHRAHQGEAADDVEVALAAGLDVAVTEGEEDNIKLTYKAEFARAERLLAERQQNKGQTMDIRTGNGFDVHRFGPGDRLWLCGVEIAHERALQGHSDADVGIHALTDALFGALAEGDIGRHFPPSDAQWKGAASDIFLRHAAGLAQAQGYAISHADVTLICERPKIGPHAQAMRVRLAAIMGIDAARVSVKATTSEGLGFTGREEGIAALATATLVKG
ncbi:MAG: bifunctional 2-C-methyl-D-erythritol 4-phosphate cytidylyltransferase/2-C-methyl-D-erythritol 2,4-cyclodiphosphate synthase [Pararhodobacter sp.]|nr:bifunctional 2-C-methyl-D-erythritol 4-phosphate cytidylyltransferase/2-C-methyl-D-erythritol 2,4-cyclodiphosphate synthase [Pararhodobacter sp.]